MDFRRLSSFIIGFGAVVFVLGIIWYLSNLPIQRSQAGGDVFGNIISAVDENLIRSAERSSATWVIGFGAVVAFAGIAIRASARNGGSAKSDRTSTEEASPAPIDAATVICPYCSKPLERDTWQTYCTHCFRHLPSETRAELSHPTTGQ